MRMAGTKRNNNSEQDFAMEELRRSVSDHKWIDALSAKDTKELENYICSQQTKIDEWKEKFEVHRCTCEQQYFELEKQLITANIKLESESSSSTELKDSHKELEKKFKEASTKLKSLQNSHEDNESSKQRFSKVNQELESEKRELAILLEKRSKEVVRVNNECKQLSKKFSDANQAKCEALAKVEEIHSQDVVAKYQKERSTQEITQLQKQVEYLNGELEKKIRDQQNILKEKTAKLLQAQSELDNKTEEVKLCKENIGSLKKVNTEQIKKIEDFNKKLKDARDGQIKMDFQFQQELQAQTKLVTLYKGLSEESEEKMKELTRAVSELQKLFKEASETHTKQDESKEAEKKKILQQMDVKDKKIQGMEKELSNANDLLSKTSRRDRGMTDESIAALSPTAAATSKLLKSGMSLTQIYNEYVQAVDELHLEKEENKRINGYLDQIMQEIEEKAPILRQQREDYEHALHTITQLTQKLDTAMEEGQKLRSETDESRRMLTYSQKESKKFTQQTVDLGQQVQYLLREVEELRGGRVVADESAVSSTEVTSSSQLITNRLVTFKTVQDLQEQNQRLLGVVRELSSKREDEEQEVTDSKTLELKQSLENALEELKDLKASRARQEELADSIIRQRDMYRVLFQQSSQQVPNVEISTPYRGRGRGGHYSPRGRGGGGILQTPQRSFPGTPISPISPNRDKELEDTKMALQELQTEYNTYKREKGEYEKMQNAQLEKLRSEISDIRVSNTKLSSQLDFSSERYKVLQNNADCYKKEINTVKEQNKKYSLQGVKLEQNVSTLHSDLVTAQESISRLEVRSQNLSSERDLVKAAEQRLVQEKENMLKEQHSQNVLLSNLQTIQNNMERVENETKSRLNHQVDVAEKELTNIKRKLENTEMEYKNTIKGLESKINNMQNQIDGEMKSHQKSKDTILNLTRQLNTQKQELSATQAKLACAETKLSKSFGTMDTRSSGTPSIHAPYDGESLAVKDLKCQLNDAQCEIKGLKDQLDKSRKHVDQYKAISESLESSLKDQNKASQHFNQNTEKKIETFKGENHAKTKKIDILEKEKEDLTEDNTKLAEEKHRMITDLRKQLSNLQNELHEAIQSRKTAITNEQTARESCQSQAKLAAEAQDKYQRELMLHAADMEAMSTLKKESVQHSQKLEAAKEAAKQAIATLTEAKNSWAEQERIVKNEKKSIESRCNDLTRQNGILHEQLAQLNNQVAYIQKSAESTNLLNTSMEEKEKSSDQLLEVIRFLRKEKEISVTRVEVAEAETVRMKQRLENVQKQYEETCKNLSEERERSQVNVHTASQHAELMRKVENLNVLSESNSMLRQEKEKLNGVVKEQSTKVKKLEDDIQPLQANIRELNSLKDTLMIEKNTLTGEVERWKARTSRLIEQCNKSDPEEHKRIGQEREDLKKQVSNLNEDNHKKKAELSRVNIAHSNTLKELNGIRTEFNKKESELVTLRNQVEEFNKEMEIKNKDVEEKAKTISQLKKIGRKYKDQAEDTAKQLNELKDNQQMQPSAAEGTSNQQAVAEANEMLEAAKKKTEEAEKKLQELHMSRTILEQEISELRTKNSELEGNQLKSKNVLQNAKVKITQQKDQLDRAGHEVTELKRMMADLDKTKNESILRENTIKSQYEGRISNLERELEEARQYANAASVEDMKQLLERLQKDNAELQAKVQQMQKQLEVKQKQQPSVSRATTPAVSADRMSLPVGETPKMANIRPMASTTPASVRQTSAQPMMSAAAAAKATASIRPMAIAPTTASPVSATTPTATVMPTSITSQESHDGITTDSPPSTSGAVPSTGRPTQQIQRVTPQTELLQESSVPATTMFSPMQMEMTTSVITSAASSSTSSAMMQVSTSSSTITSTSTVDEADEPQPSTSSTTGQSQQPQPSTSQSGNKRTRDDANVSEEDNQTKRSKTGPASMGSIPVITVTDEQTQTTVLSSSSDGQRRQDVVGPRPDIGHWSSAVSGGNNLFRSVTERPDHSASSPSSSEWPSFARLAKRGPQMTPTATNSSTVIILDSDGDQDEVSELLPTPTYQDVDLDDEDDDDEEEEVNIADDDDEDEDDDDDVIGPYSENLVSTQPYTEGGDDDVVIVEDDEEEETNVEVQVDSPDEDEQRPPDQDNSVNQAPSGPVPMGTNTGQRVQPQLLPLPERMAASAGSGSAGRSQLTPFMFQGPPGPFEEGDDCTVPSTPTLCVPRRTDGFAEAVNYSQVPQRFVFGSGDGMGPSELASQGALGMDDTRMDLSQFDDGQTRTNIPTTPHQIAPPGVHSGVFGTFQVTSAPPQQILQGESEAAREASSQESATVPSQMPGPDAQADEGGDERTAAADDGNPGEQGLAHDDDGDRSALDPQGLRKSRIQPIVWGQAAGQQMQQQQQQQQEATTSATTTPITPSSVIQPQLLFSGASAATPSPTSTVTPPPPPAPLGRGAAANVATTPRGRGGAAATNARNMRGGANTRGRGAVVRGQMARGQMTRGHGARGRSPGARGQAGRSRGNLRRST